MPVRSLKSPVLTALAVAALFALGACGEKVDDAATSRTTPPSSNTDRSSTPSAMPNTGTGMGTGADTGTGAVMALPPASAASGVRY